MKKFNVTIKQNFKVIVEVEAENEEEAINNVNDGWSNGELDLNEPEPIFSAEEIIEKNKISYKEMKKLFEEVEKEGNKYLTGYIVFSEDSFKASFTERERTYEVLSNNKAFHSNMNGYSIFGSSLDGCDINVRLENYMKEEKGGKNGWKVKYCYLKED